MELYSQMEKKLDDPVTHLKASYWQPKTLIAQKAASDISHYITDLRNELLKRSGYNENDERLAKEEQKDLVKDVFVKENRGRELYEKLVDYKKQLLCVDKQLKSELENYIYTIPVIVDSNTFVETFFSKSSLIEALAMLNQFLNNTRISENKVLSFCRVSSDAIIEDFTRVSPLIAQSSNYLKSGDFIEIKAGIGAFDITLQPRIIINGNEIPLNDSGFVRFTQRIEEKQGKHKIPVRIEYVDQDGNKKWIDRDVEYTVIKD